MIISEALISPGPSISDRTVRAALVVLINIVAAAVPECGRSGQRLLQSSRSRECDGFAPTPVGTANFTAIAAEHRVARDVA